MIELAELGPALLSWDDPTVAEAKQAVLDADLLLVASPVFKASFTGLLKLFLDHFDAGALAGKPTVPLMLGGSPAHTLAAEVHLKPVLTEIGASCPTPALYLLDSEWESEPRARGVAPSRPSGAGPPAELIGANHPPVVMRHGWIRGRMMTDDHHLDRPTHADDRRPAHRDAAAEREPAASS